MRPSFKKIETEVRRLATESPTFIYQPRQQFEEGSASCVYNPVGNICSCIFGQAMINLGHPIPSRYEGVSIHRVLDNMGIYLNSDEIGWALTVQSAQDTGEPWETAVQMGDQEVSARRRRRAWEASKTAQGDTVA